MIERESPVPSAVRCLVLGDPTTVEMRPVAEWLESNRVVRVSQDEDVDLIVVCLAHPDEFSEAESSRRRRASPLARWVVAQSTWCESIGRNLDVWPHAQRVPARWAPARLDVELAILRGERNPLPTTANRDETWAFDHANPNSEAATTGSVLVFSPDRELGSSWIDMLSEAGFDATRSAPAVGTPCVLVFDGDPWSDVVRARLEETRSAITPVAIVVPMTMSPEPPPAALAHDVHVVPKLAPAAVLLDTVRAAFATTSTHSG